VSIAVMLFFGLLLLYVVASGKARAVFTALGGGSAPASITNPNVAGA
jgi:predicted Na+-dependent transporter